MERNSKLDRTPEEMFSMVQSGAVSKEEFEAWVTLFVAENRAEAYSNGYDEGAANATYEFGMSQ